MMRQAAGERPSQADGSRGPSPGVRRRAEFRTRRYAVNAPAAIREFPQKHRKVVVRTLRRVAPRATADDDEPPGAAIT
jgi:predicted pyridoxine 5'-phosphate oxidase superfamily flavin-nucleotide-binding protein